MGSRNILSANDFQRLNKGVAQEKDRIFFYFHNLVMFLIQTVAFQKKGYNFENTMSQSLFPNLIRGQYLSTVDS